MKYKPIAIAVICSFLSLFLTTFQAYSSGKEYLIRGKTMGTFYAVKFISSQELSTALWQEKIDLRLKQVNKRLSMYDPTSELSRFNKTPPQKRFKISRDFLSVMERAGRVHALTGGAWDGTVKPLVDLWGFGAKNRSSALPGKAEIQKALAKTGFQHLDFGDGGIMKKVSGITLDLGSIAKGYGVDAVAGLLKEAGIKNYLVEIGGELAGAGRNKKGEFWAVGISRSDKKLSRQGLFKVVTLENSAIATSGNYRNFFEIEGKTYSHIIDPKTGWPVDNRVVSASVIAPDCTFADGLATALMVMDIDAGLGMVNRLDRVECLVVSKRGNKLTTHVSTGFGKLAR